MVPSSLTREEAERQIKELQRHIDSLPKNNHPTVLTCGMVFRNGSDFYITHDWNGQFGLICLTGCASGCRLSSSSVFGNRGPNAFTYLGLSNDVLGKVLTAREAPSPELVSRALKLFQEHHGSPYESMRDTLNLVLTGRVL